MIISNKHDRRKYLAVTQRSTEILRQLYDATAIGVTPIEIEKLAQELLKKHHAEASFASARNQRSTYGHATCISVNDESLHGLPTSPRPFQSGDLISVDFGIIADGFYTDQCFTVGLGQLSDQQKKLLEVGRQVVLNGIKEAVAGNTSGDVGSVMEKTARAAGFDTLKKYIGHGIGKSLHETPEVPAYGQPGKGSVLQTGMVITVEAQVVTGSTETVVDENGWTVRTKDGGNSVMFEYMVMVDDRQSRVMTPSTEWPLVK